MKTTHTPGAIKAAETITGGTYGSEKRYDTSYGKKTVVGVADIIDRETAGPELLEALERIASISLGDGLDAMRPFSEVDIMTRWAREAQAQVARGVLLSISGLARAAISKARGE